MERLIDKLRPYQRQHAQKIAAYADEARAVFAEFSPPFSSDDKPWSIPWLNDFGAFIHESPDYYDTKSLAQILGQGLVEHHGAQWGVGNEEGTAFGVFLRSGKAFNRMAVTVRMAKEFSLPLGMDCVEIDTGGLGGPQLFADLGTPGQEGITSPGQYTVGMYRALLVHCAVEIAFDNPAMRMQELIQRAALQVARQDTDVAVELYNRAVELGIEPIDTIVNETLESNGRIPLM